MRVDLTDIDYVKLLKQNLHTQFDGPAGKEVMDFLENICGYHTSIYDPTGPEHLTFINDGKRQVVATIKSILRLTPQEIVTWVKSKEG